MLKSNGYTEIGRQSLQNVSSIPLKEYNVLIICDLFVKNR